MTRWRTSHSRQEQEKETVSEIVGNKKIYEATLYKYWKGRGNCTAVWVTLHCLETRGTALKLATVVQWAVQTTLHNSIIYTYM